jgi:hypothetical protein
MSIDKIKDAVSFTKPILKPIIGCRINRYRVHKSLGDIILKIQEIILERDDEVGDLETELKAIEMLNSLEEKLCKDSVENEKKEFQLHLRNTKDQENRGKLLMVLGGTTFDIQALCNTGVLKRRLKELEKLQTVIDPWPHLIKTSTPKQQILFSIFSSASIAIVSLIVADNLHVAKMKRECIEIPTYRSNESFASFFSPYHSMVQESYVMTGNACMSSYKKERDKENIARRQSDSTEPRKLTDKEKSFLSHSEAAFNKLDKLTNQKSLQATFFLEYISKLYGSKATRYKNSTALISKYIDNGNSKNYILKKEDFDVAVKIAHILEGSQEYTTANKLYKLILDQDEDHVNALLGICTTHFKLKDQKVEDILDKCKNSIKILNSQKESKDKSKVLALAHHNYGCMFLRFEKYSDAARQFELGEKQDGENKNILRAASFSMFLAGEYKKAKDFMLAVGKQPTKVSSESSKEFHKDIKMALGLVYLKLAEKAENDGKKIKLLDDAYKNIELSEDYKVKEIYLKKINDCKNKKVKECFLPFSSKVVNHLHGKVWAFINHYQMDQNIVDAPVIFSDDDGELEDKNLKGNACTILVE